MEISDKKRFAVIMYGLADNFRDHVSKDGLRFRFEALKEFKIEEVERASMEIVQRRKYTKMPTIGEIIEAIRGNPEKQIEDVAEIQAAVVLRAIGTYGSYQSPTFEDPVTAEVIAKRFGWGHLCSYITDESKPWFVKEFKEAYLSFSRSMGNNVIEFKPGENIKKLVSKIG